MTKAKSLFMDFYNVSFSLISILVVRFIANKKAAFFRDSFLNFKIKVFIRQ